MVWHIAFAAAPVSASDVAALWFGRTMSTTGRTTAAATSRRRMKATIRKVRNGIPQHRRRVSAGGFWPLYLPRGLRLLSDPVFEG